MSESNITTWLVRSKEDGQRADRVLAAAFPTISRTIWARLFDAKGVLLAGKPIERNTKLKAGTRLEFVLPDLSKPIPQPVEMPLQIRYEDEHLLVLVKRSGVVVHGGAGETGPTLVEGLLHHCGDKLSQVGGEDRRGIVHRLDRETSGLMVVAKTDPVHERLSEEFAERRVVKEYLALLQGVPGLLAGSMRGSIGRHQFHRHKMQVSEEGREARTDWQREHHWGEVACRVRCQLHTGRTHQIRVHWSDAGFPLLGDTTYGFSPQKWADRYPGVGNIPRVMLHATKLGFHHPVSGSWCEWEEPMPEDMQSVQQMLQQFA